MLPWVSCTAILASSTSIWMNCSSSARFGWIILSATYFSKPAMPLVLARWISAIPPTAIWRTKRYGPNCLSLIALHPIALHPIALQPIGLYHDGEIHAALGDRPL